MLELRNPPASNKEGARIITASAAIREATQQAMRRDPRVFVMGEGARDPKGIFGTTLGLYDEFGPLRVMEMPISENGWTGVAIGAAMMGQRPILIHQRAEFALLSVEQLFNNAAKAHYVSAGRHRIPMVVRLVVGRGWGQGPMHSQSLEGLFAQIPGLKVVMPSNAADCKRMLLSAIADDNPVICIEHRWVHYASGHVPEIEIAQPLGGPERRRKGDALTLVANSYMLLEAMQAAEALAAEGCEVEVFDLRVVRPLDCSSIAASVERTGRLVTIDTGHWEFGLGAEISAQVCERAWARMSAAPLRIGLQSHPTPSSPSLAAAYYPRSPHIAERIASWMGLDDRARQRCVDSLTAARESLPLDIPHPSFKGPF